MNNTSVRRGMYIRLEILEVIREHIAKYGWAPTIREIGEAVGLASSSSVFWQLQNLEREGKIVLGGGPRMIRIL